MGREAGTALGILPKATKCGWARGLCRPPRRPVDSPEDRVRSKEKDLAQNQEALEGNRRRLGANQEGPGQ